MKIKQFGRTGLRVSEICLGTMTFGNQADEAASFAIMDKALDAGITFFDTADVYGQGQSEEFLGRALGARRDQVVIATKFGMALEGQGQGAAPAYVRQAAEASLRRLGTDRIDLYLLHQPDPDVPIAATLGALDDLVRAGKVREIGCSNFSVAQLREAAAAVQGGAARFVSVENEYSLLQRDPEAGVLAECCRAGLAFLPYFPLASGLLTGKYRQGHPAPEGSRLAGSPSGAERLSEGNLALVETLIQFAESRGHTILELAVSWLLAQAAVTSVIAGATTAAQVQANVAAADWHLSAADHAEFDRILAPAT